MSVRWCPRYCFLLFFRLDLVLAVVVCLVFFCKQCHMFGVHITVRLHCGLITNLRLLGMFNQRKCFSLSHVYCIKGKYRFHGFVKLLYVDDKRFILF